MSPPAAKLPRGGPVDATPRPIGQGVARIGCFFQSATWMSNQRCLYPSALDEPLPLREVYASICIGFSLLFALRPWGSLQTASVAVRPPLVGTGLVARSLWSPAESRVPFPAPPARFPDYRPSGGTCGHRGAHPRWRCRRAVRHRGRTHGAPMSRLPRVTGREALGALKRAGIVVIRTDGSHHDKTARPAWSLSQSTPARC